MREDLPHHIDLYGKQCTESFFFILRVLLMVILLLRAAIIKTLVLKAIVKINAPQ